MAALSAERYLTTNNLAVEFRQQQPAVAEVWDVVSLSGWQLVRQARRETGCCSVNPVPMVLLQQRSCVCCYCCYRDSTVVGFLVFSNAGLDLHWGSGK
jgi:hypothetical protein